jgi:DNA mismatch endonuclease (patch repair protein)
MRAIRGKGNASTEQAVARILRREGLRGWRRHLDLPGRPDFVWKAQWVAAFVDGCFWHGCPTCYKAPKRNRAFWRLKVLVNRERDAIVSAKLRASGWTVVRIRECDVGSRSTVRRLRTALASRTALRKAPRSGKLR